MSWSQFFSMGGYGFYVWGSYAIALVALGGEVLLLRQRRKSLQMRGDGLSQSESEKS